MHFQEPKPLVATLLGVCGVRIFLDSLLTVPTEIQLSAAHTNLRHPVEVYASHGILTVCPSDPPIGISLGPTNPPLIIIAEESLIFWRAGI